MLHRPEPILQNEAVPVDRTRPPVRAAERLRDGEQLIVTDKYGTGAEIIAQLRSVMPPPAEDASYAERQAHRVAFREASLRLLAPISNHVVGLEGAKTIGFFKDLYPDQASFVLPFVQVQELYGAWSRYLAGAHLAVLGHRVHPFFGTYVPTRTSHLELFGTWLSQYQGPRTRAIDVGTGCGVLALMLAKAGFERILATDNNPNAVESLRREMKRLPSSLPIDLFHGELLGEETWAADVIVFNPPWIQGTVSGLLEQALHFNDDLFERFFDQALERLSPEGRVSMVFSNMIELIQPDLPHPILAELERGRFRLVQKLQRKAKATRSSSGKKRKTRERVEIWELAKID